MNLKDALNLLGITGEDIQLDQCKTAYRKACSKYHPDRNPGGLEMMKAINAAWDYLQTLDWDRPANNAESQDANYGDALMAFINAVVNLPGIIIEVCGSWVWLSGDTKPHKDTIKEAGGRWASKKTQWYFRPEGYRRIGRGEWSMDRIRYIYGSSVVQPYQRERLPA